MREDRRNQDPYSYGFEKGYQKSRQDALKEVGEWLNNLPLVAGVGNQWVVKFSVGDITALLEGRMPE